MILLSLLPWCQHDRQADEVRTGSQPRYAMSVLDNHAPQRRHVDLTGGIAASLLRHCAKASSRRCWFASLPPGPDGLIDWHETNELFSPDVVVAWHPWPTIREWPP